MNDIKTYEYMFSRTNEYYLVEYIESTRCIVEIEVKEFDDETIEEIIEEDRLFFNSKYEVITIKKHDDDYNNNLIFVRKDLIDLNLINVIYLE